MFPRALISLYIFRIGGAQATFLGLEWEQKFLIPKNTCDAQQYAYQKRSPKVTF